MSTLPRRATDLPSALRAISDLQDVVRSMPDVEFKTIIFVAANLNTNPPLQVSKRVKNVAGVSVARIVDTKTPENRVPITGFGWQLAVDGSILLTSLTGPTAGTEYAMTIKIEGTR